MEVQLALGRVLWNPGILQIRIQAQGCMRGYIQQRSAGRLLLGFGLLEVGVIDALDFPCCGEGLESFDEITRERLEARLAILRPLGVQMQTTSFRIQMIDG